MLLGVLPAIIGLMWICQEQRESPVEPSEALAQTETEYADTPSNVGNNTKEPVESYQPAPSVQTPVLLDVEDYPRHRTIENRGAGIGSACPRGVQL